MDTLTTILLAIVVLGGIYFILGFFKSSAEEFDEMESGMKESLRLSQECLNLAREQVSVNREILAELRDFKSLRKDR